MVIPSKVVAKTQCLIVGILSRISLHTHYEVLPLDGWANMFVSCSRQKKSLSVKNYRHKLNRAISRCHVLSINVSMDLQEFKIL
jgi:hypothetical protein